MYGRYASCYSSVFAFSLDTSARSSGVVEDREMPALPWPFFTKNHIQLSSRMAPLVANRGSQEIHPSHRQTS